MKLNRIIAFLAVIATTLSTAVAGTSANTSAVGNDKVEVYEKITIDQNTDLSALGLEGVVAFSAPDDNVSRCLGRRYGNRLCYRRQ